MKTIKTSSLLILVLMIFGCSSVKKNTPISVEHAECLFSFAFSGLPEGDVNEVNSNDCEGNLKWEQSERWNTCEEHGFAYKIEFNEGDKYVVNMYYNSPGSAVFSNLVVIEIKDDVFKLIETIASGDRCQHGIVSDEVKYENDHLFYSQLITPFHLMSWFDRELPFDAYDNCMVCCVGSANYKYNPKTQQKEFINIELLPDGTDGENKFSLTYNSFLKQGKRVLNEDDIRDFIRMVEKE